MRDGAGLKPDRISEEQWSIYERVISTCQAEGIEFAVGGGLAIGVYTGQWRETKDIDLYVLPRDRERMQGILTRLGLEDFYDQLPYDRGWIYRTMQDNVIVDVIWAMANYKTEVDEIWTGGGPMVTLRGMRFRVVPPEEMIWAKLYVMQKDRCDWPDVMNIIYAQRQRLDWGHLIERLGADAPLLEAALSIYRWICPTLGPPRWIYDDMAKLPGAERMHESAPSRVDLLDRRPWFNTSGC